VDALLRHTACCYDGSRQLGMEAARAIGDAGEVPSMERRRLQEPQHAIIRCRTRHLHEVVDQRIAASPIRMQKPAR
jgi:hypothetical protein